MRKGSLQLSVNAIVVLVLAITMLGLGLAFTKGKFSELGERIEIPEPDYPATEAKPIVLSVNEIQLKQGKAGGFSVNYYNSGAGDYFVPCLVCKEADGFTDDVLEYGSTGLQGLFDAVYVQGGEYSTFRLIINDPGPDNANQYPGSTGKVHCTVGMVRSATASTACLDGDAAELAATISSFEDSAQLTLFIR